jgi:hypothetical protein
MGSRLDSWYIQPVSRSSECMARNVMTSKEKLIYQVRMLEYFVEDRCTPCLSFFFFFSLFLSRQPQQAWFFSTGVQEPYRIWYSLVKFQASPAVRHEPESVPGIWDTTVSHSCMLGRIEIPCMFESPRVRRSDSTFHAEDPEANNTDVNPASRL